MSSLKKSKKKTNWVEEKTFFYELKKNKKYEHKIRKTKTVFFLYLPCFSAANMHHVDLNRGTKSAIMDLHKVLTRKYILGILVFSPANKNVMWKNTDQLFKTISSLRRLHNRSITFSAQSGKVSFTINTSLCRNQ